MEKEEKKKTFPEEEILFLGQLIKALEDSEPKLEEYYNNKDTDNFNNVKKLMISISKKISGTLK